ncbi:MAG: glycosyltransferase family 2 protein [Clostridia bacterium]|nr:glycosyltransferase family 2 protein [Clostridia bacterium]
MNKLISVAVPCYNSAGYMRKCIESLLTGGEEVEIIIVNDGSTDDTAKIADEYAEKYPTIVKVIHKENGGHGSGVNAGIKNASGLYFKVVDSDDWVNEEAFKKLLDTVRGHLEDGNAADLYITNYVYEHASDNTTNVIHYRKELPSGVLMPWDKVKKFRMSRFLMIHSLLYKLSALRESDTVLPEKTFYVDNLYAYKPLPFMKTIYYLDVDLYRYFIGRADQSVNVTNLVKRYEQQMRVSYLIADSYTYDEIKAQPKGLRNYMFHSQETVMVITLISTCCGKPVAERKAALKAFWQHVKAQDKKLYKWLRWRSYATVCYLLPWGLRAKALLWGYGVAKRKLKLG